MSDARRRLDELLLIRATEGLSPADAAELDRLLAQHPGVDANAYETAAAIVSLASLAELPPLPRSLRSALEQRADDFISEMSGRRPR